MAQYMNEGNLDRAVRFMAGLALLYLGWTGVVGGAVGMVFKFGGFLPLVTGLIGWCPAYALLGFTTRDASRDQPALPRPAA